MKPRKQKCSRCEGSGEIEYLPHNPNATKETIFDFKTKECPDCNGEGEEYIISPKQWKEYNNLKKLLYAGNVTLTVNKPLDAVSENKGKISLK